MTDKTLTFIYPTMIVHKIGCKDIKKDRTSADTMVNVSGTLSEAIAKELSIDLAEMGYTADDFIVKPCAK